MVLGGVFLFAAIPKLQDPGTFAQSIQNYHLVPDSWARLLAFYLPAIEVVVAASLVVGVGARAAALLALGMLIVFVGAMAFAMIQGINVDCGCFGSAQSAQIGWTSIARNVVLSGLAVLVLFLGGATPKAAST
jgi:putative oxidoreductase